MRTILRYLDSDGVWHYVNQGPKGDRGLPGAQGERGFPGDAGTVYLGNVSTGAPGTNAIITNTGTPSVGVLNFTIPRGDKGDKGDTGSTGAAATIAVGTVTTGAAGTNALVTNSGTSSAATFNFTIPRGDKGDKGDKGDTGPQGPVGPAGPTVETVFTSDDVAGIPLTARGFLGQTGNLQQWENSAGSVLARVSSSGQIFEGANRVYSAGNAPPYPVTSVNTRTGAVTGLAEANAVVALTGNQTIAGVKTFSSAPSVPTNSWSIAQTNGLQAALDSKYSATNPPPVQDLSGYVQLAGSQTITGAKTFSVAPVVPDDSWTIANTANLQGALDSKYSATNAPPYPVTTVAGRTGAVTLAVADISNAVSINTTQTITAAKTFSALVTANARLSARNDTTSTDYTTSQLEVYASGTGKTARIAFHIGGVVAHQIGTDDTGLRTFSQAGTGLADFRAGSLYDSGARVYSSNNKVPVSGVSATGTPSASNYLRGDGTWASIDLSTLVTLGTAQTITAQKTFSVAPVVPDGSWTVAKTNGLQAALDSKYSATNPQPMTGYATEAFVDTRVAALVDASPGTLDTLNELAAALGDDPNFATTVTNQIATKVSLTGDETISGIKTFSSTPVVPDASFGIAKISGTGTRNTTTFFRGDGTFAVPAYPVTSVNTRTGAVTGLAEDNAVVKLTGTQTIAGVKTFSSAPVVPDSSFTIAKISATGTRDATTFLRGDGTFAAPPAPVYPVTSVNTRTGAVTGLAEDAAVVHLTGAETIAGVKTFSSAPVVPDSSFTINKINASGARSSTTYLSGSGTFSTPPAPSNMMTVNTSQSIPGSKIFTAAQTFMFPTYISPTTAASATTTTVESPGIIFRTNYWDGAASVGETADLYLSRTGTAAGNQTFVMNAGLQVQGIINEYGNRVYSAANPPPAPDLSGYVTLNTTQNIVGNKTFSPVDVAVTPLIVQGLDGQTADLVQFQRFDGTASVRIAHNLFSVGGATALEGTFISATSGRLQVNQQLAGAPNPVITAKGASGQTGNLQEWQIDDGTVVTSVSPSGVGKFGLDAQTVAGSRLVVSQDTAGAKGIIVRASSGATGNLQEWQNSAGTVIVRVTAAGALGIGSDNTYFRENGTGYLDSTAPAIATLVLQGAASQTANIQEWQNSSGTVLAAINAAGKAVGTGFAKTVRIPHTFTVSGEVKVESGDDYVIPGFFVPVPSGQTVVYRGLRMYCTTGSVVFQLRFNGVNVFGGTTSATATNNSSPYGVGDGTGLSNETYVRLAVQSVSGTPKNLSVTIYLDYTV